VFPSQEGASFAWDFEDRAFALLARLTLHGSIGTPEAWQATAGLTSELGQLPSFAKAAHRLYGDA
jgi:hypothetical protein